MKHLKPYQLFESQDIVMAGVENAMRNRNVELFKDLIQQHSEYINYQYVVNDIINNNKYEIFSFLTLIPPDYFDGIRRIYIPNNSGVTELNISMFRNLENFTCRYNKLISLDFSNNPKLLELYCEDNELTSLNISNCSKLEYLNCFDNNLTELDVSNNPKLWRLYCFKNELIELDVSNNTELRTLNCERNDITAMDITKNIKLQTFVHDIDKVNVIR